MQTQELKMDHNVAFRMRRAYLKHVAMATPADLEVIQIYKEIEKGRTIIRAIDSIVAAGLHPLGHKYAALPLLAICRADAHACFWRPQADMGNFTDGNSGRRNAHPSHRVEVRNWPGLHWNLPNGRAVVPPIPLHLRPKRALARYHILFEAEWVKVPPHDPMLLERIGQSDAWIVHAAWDLSAAEKAVLATRLT